MTVLRAVTPAILPLAALLAGMTLAAWNIFWVTKTIRAFAKKR